MAKRLVALLGDTSSHAGTITTSNQDGTVKAEGKVIPVDGALHSCPIQGHGVTTITTNLDEDFNINGKKVVLDESKAGCGASIIASSIKTYGS